MFLPSSVPKASLGYLSKSSGRETAHQVDEEPVVPQQVEMELYAPVLVLPGRPRNRANFPG